MKLQKLRQETIDLVENPNISKKFIEIQKTQRKISELALKKRELQMNTYQDFKDGLSEMTEKYLTDILTNAIKKFKLIDGIIFHRIGDLKPSDPIVLVATWSEHRDSAFKATREIMEFLKSEAPLWKKESNSWAVS